MKSQKIKGIKDKGVFLPIITLVVSLLLFSLKLLGGTRVIEEGIHWIADPVMVLSENTGRSVNGYFTTFANIPSLQKEITDLELEILNYKAKLSYTTILEKENIALREQLDLLSEEHTYIEAKALGVVQDSTIRVNRGNGQGVEVGDTVSLGYSYIGTIMETSRDISVVRLPTSKSSTLKVTVVSKDDQQETLSKAVVKGSGEGFMTIENISKDSNVKVGDYVVVNDEKVIESLVLGEITELDLNPANISITGKVTPIVDIESLVTLFICIEW